MRLVRSRVSQAKARRGEGRGGVYEGGRGPRKKRRESQEIGRGEAINRVVAEEEEETGDALKKGKEDRSKKDGETTQRKDKRRVSVKIGKRKEAITTSTMRTG